MFDALTIDTGASAAATAATSTGTIAPKGEIFNITAIAAEVACTVDMTVAGNNIAPQGNGIYIPGNTASGASAPILHLPKPIRIAPGRYSITVLPGATALSANGGFVCLYGYWSNN